MAVRTGMCTESGAHRIGCLVKSKRRYGAIAMYMLLSAKPIIEFLFLLLRSQEELHVSDM